MMKQNLLVLVFACLYRSFSFADIGNFHALSDKVFRSAAPGASIQSVMSLGLSKVLIFKNETGGEVQKEIQSLHRLGFRDSDIFHVPMLWKSPSTIESNCEHLVQALAILVNVELNTSERILFHCTAGEDRTGALAGLFRILVQRWPFEKAFEQEMCQFGYEAGDRQKPDFVVKEVREHLTPAVILVNELIQNNSITIKNLDSKVCSNPYTSSVLVPKVLRLSSHYYCR